MTRSKVPGKLKNRAIFLPAAYSYSQSPVVPGRKMNNRISKHYSSEQWVDFVMNQTTQSQGAEMQGHLDSGCQSCSQLLGLWKRVSQFAARERSLEPPDSAVRHVQAAFANIARAQKAERMPLIPRLSFDSLWQATAPAGIRSASAGPRKLLYKVKDITIEIHTESEGHSERSTLTGQISIGSLQGQTLPPIPVVISGKSGKLASTETTGFGEFHLSYLAEADSQITLVLPDRSKIVIPLDDQGGRAFFS